MKKTLLMVIVGMVALPGCFTDLGGTPFDEPIEPNPYGRTDTELRTEDPYLSGDLGNVTSGTIYYVRDAYDYGGVISIDLRSRGRDGVIMNRIELNGPGLEVGQRYSVNGGDNGEFYASVIGCSGVDDDQWTYDRPADDAVVDVREGPEEGSVELFLTAGFSDYEGSNSYATEGSVVLY